MKLSQFYFKQPTYIFMLSNYAGISIFVFCEQISIHETKQQQKIDVALPFFLFCFVRLDLFAPQLILQARFILLY